MRQTLFELLPDVPALFRLCMSAVAAAVLLLIPLAAGLGAIYLFALADHEISTTTSPFACRKNWQTFPHRSAYS